MNVFFRQAFVTFQQGWQSPRDPPCANYLRGMPLNTIHDTPTLTLLATQTLQRLRPTSLPLPNNKNSIDVPNLQICTVPRMQSQPRAVERTPDLVGAHVSAAGVEDA